MSRDKRRNIGEGADELSFRCPTCKAVVRLTVSELGRKVSCSRCGQKVQLPKEHKNKTILLEPSALTRVGSAGSSEETLETAPVGAASEPQGLYLIQNGVRAGPFSLEYVQSLADRGTLKPTDMVLPVGSSKWTPAGTIAQLSFPRPRLALKALWLTARTLWKGLAFLVTGLVALIVWICRDRRRLIPAGAAIGLLLLVFGWSRWRDRNGGRQDQAQGPLPTRLSGQKIYEKVLKSTVWINNPGQGFGSGSLINAEEKLVLTNYHVVCRPPTLVGTLWQSHNNVLRNTDPRDPALNFPYKMYQVDLARDKIYVIDMESKQFDTYLQVVDNKGRVLAEDDDSGGDHNARIRFVPPYSGRFAIVATTFDGGIGNFTLRLSYVELKQALAAFKLEVAPFVLVNFPDYQGDKVIADKNYYLKLTKGDKEKYKATVVAVDEAKDLAILKLNHVADGAEALALAAEGSQPGAPVHSIGNPGRSGALWVYTSGTVRTAAYRKEWQSMGNGGGMKHDATILETQSPTNPGDSGGPLTNEFGELVGVTHGTNIDGNAISLFIDIGEVRALLRAHNFRWMEKGRLVPND